MIRSNSELGNAFPAPIRHAALNALSKFPEFPAQFHWRTFPVRVGGEVVAIPTRVYHDPKLIASLALSSLQRELADCLLTRHHNGFVRQKHLERIICSENIWIPPFVVQLIGEYVIEILEVIHANLRNLNLPVYELFIRCNPEFVALTEQRVMSYWNEYYRRGQTRYSMDEYVGFRLIKFLKSLGRNGRSK